MALNISVVGRSQILALLFGLVASVLLILKIHLKLRVRSVSKMNSSPPMDSCFNGSVPQPYIMMSLGRSGSSSTMRVLGEVTGMLTPYKELTGSSNAKTIKFFNSIYEEEYRRGGQWMLQSLCNLQSKYPDAGIVAFKWKPWSATIHHPESVAALRLASQTHPQVKVVRSRRNVLDVHISRVKHVEKTPAHCKTEKCQKKQLERKIELPVSTLILDLEALTHEEDDVDRLLVELNVPHIQVTYENLYYSDSPAEWKRIIDFLGMGPKSLTLQDVHDALDYLPTSNYHHNDSLENYDEVYSTLKGTKFEPLLH